MKKLLVMFLALSLIFGLVGCSSGTTETEETAEAATTEETAEATDDSEDKLIVYANKGLDYYFWTICQASTEQACEDRGWSFEASDAALDSAQQFDQIVNFISKDPDAIVTDPNDSEGLVAATDQAVAAGIPVAVVDTPLTSGDIAVTVAFDNYEAGVLAGEAIVAYLVEKYGEATGTVVYPYGAMSSEAWRLRKEGTEAVLSEYPDITYIDLAAEGEISLTQDAVLTQIAAGVEIDVITVPSDNPGQGVVAALKMEDLWYPNTDENHIGIVTIDGEPIANTFIESGYYDYTIVQDAYSYGNIAIEMLDTYTFNGEEVPLGTYENDMFYWETCEIVESDAGPYVKVPAYELNSDNVTDERHWGNVAEDVYGIAYDMSATEIE